MKVIIKEDKTTVTLYFQERINEIILLKENSLRSDQILDEFKRYFSSKISELAHSQKIIPFFIQERFYTQFFYTFFKYQNVFNEFENLKLKYSSGFEIDASRMNDDFQNAISILARYKYCKQNIKFISLLRIRFYELFLFLISICALLRSIFKKRQAAVYTIDKNEISSSIRDNRAEKLYADLENRAASYLEFVHTSSVSKSIKRFLVRPKSAIYFEILSKYLSFKKISNNQGGICDYIFDSMLTESNAQNDLLKKIFKLLNFKALYSIDDGRYLALFLSIANRSAIKSKIYQHGLLYDRHHVGLAGYEIENFPGLKSNFIVTEFNFYSDYFAERFKQLSKHISIKNYHIIPFSNVLNSENKIKDNSNNKKIVWIYEPDFSLDELQTYLEVLSKVYPNIYLKCKPQISISEINKIKKHTPDNVIIETEAITETYFNNVALFIGSYSSLLFEAIYYKVPVIEVKNTYGKYQAGLPQEAGFSLCQNSTEIISIIDNKLSETSNNLGMKRNFIWGKLN